MTRDEFLAYLKNKADGVGLTSEEFSTKLLNKLKPKAVNYDLGWKPRSRHQAEHSSELWRKKNALEKEMFKLGKYK